MQQADDLASIHIWQRYMYIHMVSQKENSTLSHQNSILNYQIEDTKEKNNAQYYQVLLTLFRGELLLIRLTGSKDIIDYVTRV